MKTVYFGLILFILCVNLSCTDTKNSLTKDKTKLENQTRGCDSLNTTSLIDSVIAILNRKVPSFKAVDSNGFYISKNQEFIGFFIYDLTDTLNNTVKSTKNFKYLEGHIYHFAPILSTWSFSHIVFCENGKFIFFSALNCENKGDKIEYVLNYLLDKGIISKEDVQLISRLKNYSSYGNYIFTDVHSVLNCNDYVE